MFMKQSSENSVVVLVSENNHSGVKENWIKKAKKRFKSFFNENVLTRLEKESEW